MSRLVVTRDFADATIPDAEALWYDLARWPAWVDGFGHVSKQEGDWPQVGAVLIWDSPPGGRGRVLERVLAYERGVGQELSVEDERMRARQWVAFEQLADGLGVTLTLDYELLSGGPLRVPLDLLFVRRALRDSLARVLVRFGVELAADREL